MSKSTEPLNVLSEAWIEPDEGQLSVDVIETYDKVIVRTAIAGVKPEDVDLYIAEDVMTIRGSRSLDEKEEIGSTYHFRECYWGGFSRTIVLPAHIRPEGADAVMRQGVLTVTLPKAVVEKKISIRFEED